MKEEIFVEKIRAQGGTPYIVGGWVRDFIRQAMPKDKDYMVTGLNENDFLKIFPMAKPVGKSFPVFLLKIDAKISEVALARRDIKVGSGYRGFSIIANAEVSLEEDLYRRDTTINSMALELPQKILHDPYNGKIAIKQRKIIAVSEHFIEDPVRSLRAARQAAEFDFSIDSGTYKYMQLTKNELKKEPAERILAELNRALKTNKPSIFFRSLQQADLLTVTFPEIARLIGKTQPKEFHPEGDAFEHTMLVLDEVAKITNSVRARFCALVHDLGKGLTPKQMEPHHYGHEITGITVLDSWNKRMIMPRDWLQAGKFVIKEHMRAPRLSKPAKILNLLLAINKEKITTDEFNAVILADNHSLPDYLVKADEFIKILNKISGSDAPQNLCGKQIAEWLHARRLTVLKSLISVTKTS